MWVVAKIKTKEVKIFKKNLVEKSGKDIQFYCPKIEYHQYLRKKNQKIRKISTRELYILLPQEF